MVVVSLTLIGYFLMGNWEKVPVTWRKSAEFVTGTSFSFFLSIVHLFSKINGGGVGLMFIIRSSGMSYASTTSLIARSKENRISFRKPEDTDCLAVVVRLLVKPIPRKIDWHHEKFTFNFKLPPFSFKRFDRLPKQLTFDGTPGFYHLFLKDNQELWKKFSIQSAMQEYLSFELFVHFLKNRPQKMFSSDLVDVLLTSIV